MKLLNGFDKCVPEEVGISSLKLHKWWDTLVQKNTRSLLILKDQKIVFEEYLENSGPTTKEELTSLTKPVIAGMLLILAMNDGFIHPEDYAYHYIPGWESDPMKSKIKIKHLATHNSGIVNDDSTSWGVAFNNYQGNPYQIARDQFPVQFEPGSRFQYSSAGMANLTYAVAVAIKSQLKDFHMRSYLQEHLMDPLGISETDWSVYETEYNLDGMSLVVSWDKASITPLALVKIGQLMVSKGYWYGKQIIDEQVINKVLSPSGCFGNGGLVWSINFEHEDQKILFDMIPADSFMGQGLDNQMILAMPSINCVIVRFGRIFEYDPFYWRGIVKYFFNPIMELFSNH